MLPLEFPAHGGNSSGAPIDQTNGNFLGGCVGQSELPILLPDVRSGHVYPQTAGHDIVEVGAGLKSSEIVQIGASRNSTSDPNYASSGL